MVIKRLVGIPLYPSARMISYDFVSVTDLYGQNVTRTETEKPCRFLD
jgi:hypothetical protein